MKQLLIYSILFLILITAVSASEGHMKLLAVSSEGNGTTADLYLEIQRGSGRVFMDTFPFTKFDTQLSTRLAKDIACDFLEIDCSNYDFIYTIRADSPIIGGPSAGAAFTILTISLLDDIEVEETTTITGTINAGGFIGDVGSISKKIDAAAKQGIKKVLIPKGDRFEEIKEETTRYGRYYRRNLTRINESKTTLDLYEHGNRLGVEVVEVSNLYEAVYETTGKQFPQETGNITPDEWYTDTMKEVSIILCNRTKGFRDQLNLENLNNNSIYNMGLNLTIQAIDSFDDNDYYAGASFCFGANVKYDFLFLNQTNTSYKEAINTTEILRESINQSFKNLREQELNSIASLQTYIIVNERLIEAELILEEINTLNETQLQDYLYNLAFATERLYSAYAWSMFFDKNNAKLKLNEEILKNSCIRKLSEVDEHYQYTILMTYLPMDEIEADKEKANEFYEQEDYVMCLFKASKAKAQMDMLLGVIGLDEDNLNEVVESRLDLVKSLILKQQKQGIFPILGYSYYEYGKVLAESDPYSALIYSHYSLEFSNMDLYLKVREKKKLFNFDRNNLYIFSFGLIVGILLTAMIHRKYRKRFTKKKW